MPNALADARRRAALLELLRLLEREGYDFVTVTPATHARVIGRPGRAEARTVRDVLGWSLPFRVETVPPPVLALLRAGEVLETAADGRLRATLRVSRVGGTLFLHSAYPTEAQDSVFLGPDSYRFADLIAARMEAADGARILDYGAGAGVGGIVAARMAPGAQLTLADVNARALVLASVNAEAAGAAYSCVETATPTELTGPYDLIVANPPFIMDAEGRAYRDGGDLHGAQLSLDWSLAAAPLLAPGGRLILYTGIAVIDGEDALKDRLLPALAGHGLEADYRELDPDIFGEELEQPAYRDVERIAAVGLVATRSA